MEPKFARCDSQRTLLPSSPSVLHPISPLFSFDFQILQEHRKVSLSSLDQFTEYEQRNLFGLKQRAYTTIGVEGEDGKDTDGRREDKMLIASGATDAAECQSTKEVPPSDNSTSGNTTPRQRRKRRSAAERRESHRRRSSAVVNDAVHLARVFNGLPQQKQKHVDKGGEDEPCPVIKPFSPIPDRSETDNDETATDLFHEPPEPSAHAPGDDETQGEETVDEDFDLISRFNEKLFTGQLYWQRAPDKLGTDSLEHRRSLSADHLLYGIGLRREVHLLDTDQLDFAYAIQEKVRNSGPICADSNKNNNNNNEIRQERGDNDAQKGYGKNNESGLKDLGDDVVHATSMDIKRPPVSRQSPLLAQIKKQQKLSSTNERLPYSELRCASSAVNKLNNNRSKEGVSIEEAAGSLSGPEPTTQTNDTSRWEKEMNRSSNVSHQRQHNEGKTKGNCKRRNSSVSTLSAPCAHSIPTSSNVFLHLVDRFVSKRQYSDSNLLSPNANKQPSSFGENFCRRSFKWNLFWGRKEPKCRQMEAKRKSGEGKKEEGMVKDHWKKSVIVHCQQQQQRKNSRLGILVEDMDMELGEERERKKRHPADGSHHQQQEVDSGIRCFGNAKAEGHLPQHQPVHREGQQQQQQMVRMRTNSSLELDEERKREEEDKRKCSMDSPAGTSAVTTQRFSLIGPCDLAKFEESMEGTNQMMDVCCGVRRTTSLKEKYKVKEEDSLKLDMFLKERRMRITAERDDEGAQSEEEEENADGGVHLDALHYLASVKKDQHAQQQQQNFNLKNLKKVISPQLNNIITTTPETTTSTMPRKKNNHSSNIPRKSSICFHNVGTLKRKKGMGKSQLARRRSSYVTKAQVLMAKSKIQKDDGLTKHKATKNEHEGEGNGMTKGGNNEEGKRPSEVATKTDTTVTLREGAKLLAKQRGASVSSSSLRQLLIGSERKASRGSKVAPKTNSNGSKDAYAEKERTEKDKKRESRTNSALLGTIWSIRPRRRMKENNRSLANLFCHQNDTKFNKDESRKDESDAQEVPSADSPKKFTLAQSPGTATFSFDQIPDLVSVLSPAIFSRSQMNNPRWDDLNIWDEEAPSWTAKFPTESPKLEGTERKRQNIIYELMMTEKNHCQVLILLRQVYQEGLIRNGILDKPTVKKLIPDVLDVLLDFHLNLLRRFRSRTSEETVVRDISDIICDGFVDSPIRVNVIQSYTTFCLAREHSHALLATLMAQKAIVRKFFEHHESEHKDRSFKDCMLLVAQRLTKYPILIEQILKYESSVDQKLRMQKAHFAAKAFALEINDGLLRYERKIQWEAVKKALEKGSAGKLIDPKAKQDFTYADLVEPVEETFSDNEWGRKVHLVQRVFWRETMTSPDVELRLLLCDDIIVFLRPKGGSIGSSGTTGGMAGAGMERKEFPLQFFRHNSHSGVLPLYNTLVKGENLRRKSVLLIVTDKEQPDLIQLAFPTSPEMEQCVLAIKQAKANAPKFVRLSKRRIFELSQRSIGEGTSTVEREYQTKMDTWQRELERIFVAYNEDSLLSNYFECRMAFFDAVRAHLYRCPLRNFTPSEEQQQKQRTAEREKERLSALLKVKFEELARKRHGALAHLVERAQRARDEDLPSFFDDLYDLGAAGNTPTQSSSSSDDQLNQTVGSSDSCENQTKATECGGKKKPRRVRTYHGHGSTEQKSLSGSSASSAGGTHPIRRHTTVPAGGHHMESSDEECVEMDSEIRKLPQKMNPMSRKAATEIIRDNIRLRSQNDRLKRESALKDLQLVSLRSRKGPLGETPERLESLRQKQEEFQAEKKEFLTECQRREEKFRANCAGREEELRRIEDELRERADEFVRLKEELEKLKKEQKETETVATTTTAQHSKDHPKTVDNGQTSTNRTTTTTTARTPSPMDKATPMSSGSSSAMRISNTYCGAGPIPRPSTSHHHQQLQHQHEQHADGAEFCSFGEQPVQLVERRAVSQLELPRHLVVKTETKQADKVRKLRKN